MKYTVISTSCWIGDTWSIHSYHARRADAVAAAAALPQHKIAAVIGRTHGCPIHQFCEIGDTSRVRVGGAPALTSRRCHITPGLPSMGFVGDLAPTLREPRRWVGPSTPPRGHERIGLGGLPW